MALLLLGKGDVLEAERHARNAVRIAPDNPQSHYLMGLVMDGGVSPGGGRIPLSAGHRIAGPPRAHGARQPCAVPEETRARSSRRGALYEEALQAAPEMLHTLLGYARLEEADRNLEPALSLLDRAATIAPENPSVKTAARRGAGPPEECRGGTCFARYAGGARPGELGPSEWLEKGPAARPDGPL